MTSFNKQFNELVKVTSPERQQIRDQADGDENIKVVDEPVKSQDFFQDNNPPGKKYIATRVNSRNFLSKIAYVGLNKEDFYNDNFIFDVYLLATKNLNLFSLDIGQKIS